MFNRAIDGREVYLDKRYYWRMLLALWFFRYDQAEVRLARYLEVKQEVQQAMLHRLVKASLIVEVLAYCLMPNYFHLLIKQKTESGLSRYIGDVENSFTKYFNYRQKRRGPIFLPRFKAVDVGSDEQLLHLSRYIHLNPLTSYVVQDEEGLDNYIWSSWQEYMGEITERKEFCIEEVVLEFFENRKAYREFVLRNIDDQREMKRLRDMEIESG